jgi:hypothetical protein
VIDQVLAEAKLEAEDPEMDESVPEPPSKSLIRQLQRAIRLSESDKVQYPFDCVLFGHSNCNPFAGHQILFSFKT